MRARHKPWADDYLKKHTEYVVLEPESLKGNWQSRFSQHQPIYLEIGAGKGQFITGMADQFPSINFVAIELVKSIIVSALDKVVESKPDNVQLINTDAKDLRSFFGEGEVDRIYLNFSDPWPKNKHEKRRLTYHTFLEQYKEVLKEGGDVILKTDNRHLFEYSLTSFSQFGMVLDEVTLDLHELEDPTNVMTEYEEKFSSRGQPIYRVQARFQ
ncbi:tRNA (guanine-N(7)-)-methyltransferase [Pelagirhabdus alkalitolerans]|uniref:tRNA (guanine-N(7)-)-methyltransferase n=1 Tax=Pelagirhabdus alkalitolerans TaxID=1612202 RepID=A0A1G6HKE4_9BACI|nr:tRNA (guanosine(46)-N7)-methyltransferase TrmB [Pelagirhabdus alkalitolerans]SDB93896.1 tRNA (guanine-N(7)-)-methyltransferase [Pelagirhabdus alkalitolerans]